MAIPPRTMSPSFRFKALNPAFQSDPRRILGQQLQQQGLSSAPVRTPLQGLGRLSSALIGAYLQKGAIDRQVAREDERTKQIMGMIPQDADPGLRTFAMANPDAFANAFGQSLLTPTTSSEVVNLGGNLRGVQTTQTSPFGPTSTAISNLTQIKETPQTSLYKNAISAGLTPGSQEFKDFMTKNSSRQTNINMVSSPGSKSTVDRFEKLNALSDTSFTTLNKLEELEGYLEEGVRTGFGVETATNLQKIKQFFNKDYKVKEIAGVENFNAAATGLVLPLVKQLGVNPTDNDLVMTQKGATTLGKSVEGNRLLIKTLKLSNARQIFLFDALNKFIQRPENKNIESEGLQGRARIEAFLTKVKRESPIFAEAGKLLQEEYRNLTGEEMGKKNRKSKIDALINSGDILK